MKFPNMKEIVKNIEVKSIVDFEMEFSDFYDKYPKDKLHTFTTEALMQTLHTAFKAGSIVGSQHTFNEIREILENL